MSLLVLVPKASWLLKDYRQQLTEGVEPTFTVDRMPTSWKGVTAWEPEDAMDHADAVEYRREQGLAPARDSVADGRAVDQPDKPLPQGGGAPGSMIGRTPSDEPRPAVMTSERDLRARHGKRHAHAQARLRRRSQPPRRHPGVPRR